MTQPAKTLIAFATAWGTKFGGINSFNADLLDAVTAAFFSHLRTICVVLHATPDDIQAAQRNQITLVGLGLADKKRTLQRIRTTRLSEITSRSRSMEYSRYRVVGT